MESQVEKMMRCLQCSKEEAEQIIADDKAIDRGEKMYFDLDKETEKQAKKYANVGTKQPKTGKTERKHKENPTKAMIIAEISELLKEKGCENIEIVNKEGQIVFKFDENTFKIMLSQKRKPK